jgi:hypothetical protein
MLSSHTDLVQHLREEGRLVQVLTHARKNSCPLQWHYSPDQFLRKRSVLSALILSYYPTTHFIVQRSFSAMRSARVGCGMHTRRLTAATLSIRSRPSPSPTWSVASWLYDTNIVRGLLCAYHLALNKAFWAPLSSHTAAGHADAHRQRADHLGAAHARRVPGPARGPVAAGCLGFGRRQRLRVRALTRALPRPACI